MCMRIFIQKCSQTPITTLQNKLGKKKTMHELSLDMNLPKAQNDFSRPVFISHVAV